MIDSRSQWYAANRRKVMAFWILASSLLGILALYFDWKFAVAWSLVAAIGFILTEKMFLRRMDDATPQ